MDSWFERRILHVRNQIGKNEGDVQIKSAELIYNSIWFGAYETRRLNRA